MTDLTVHHSDDPWKESVLLSGCFGIHSVVPTRGEKLEQVVSSVINLQ